MIRTSVIALALRSTAEFVPVLLLFATMFFFLWMFLAAESLQETAAAGRFPSPEGADPAAVAERYSYEWRHGMVGGWPLFVPGFFAVAVATVLWSSGRTIRGVVVQGALALLFALLAAKLLTPLGTEWLTPYFERDTGLVLAGSPVQATWSAAIPGILTLASWAALMVALQVCVTSRSIWPLLAPLACYSVLAVVRPGDFGDLFRPWALGLSQGDSVAIVSTALIPLVAAVLWRYCVCFRAGRGRARAGKSGMQRLLNCAQISACQTRPDGAELKQRS